MLASRLTRRPRSSVMAPLPIDSIRRVESFLLWPFVLGPFVLGPFVLGLGFSITLAQVSLSLLALCWLARLTEPGRWQSLRFPLLAPCVALALVTIIAALASARPGASLVASEGRR